MPKYSMLAQYENQIRNDVENGLYIAEIADKYSVNYATMRAFMRKKKMKTQKDTRSQKSSINESNLDVRKATKCFCCANACINGCSWASSLVPVDGWKVDYREISGQRGEIEARYTVIDCPEFVPDPEGPYIPKDREACEELLASIIKETAVNYKKALQYLKGRPNLITRRDYDMNAIKNECELFFNEWGESGIIQTVVRRIKWEVENDRA